jgi:hypothetical protein
MLLLGNDNHKAFSERIGTTENGKQATMTYCGLRTCDWKFVRSSYIGGDISDQNYLEETVLLNKMKSFSL